MVGSGLGSRGVVLLIWAGGRSEVIEYEERGRWNFSWSFSNAED